MSGVPWRCRCGEVELSVTDVPRAGGHLVCYCADCRAFARISDAADTLDTAGGVSLYQTAPEHIGVVRGAEHFRAMRLTQRGPYRWYAGCCGTPLANTAPMRGAPFVSLMGAGFPNGILGKPVARVHRGSATGKVPRPHGSALALMAGVFGRLARSRLSGGWRQTPFFDGNGAPVSEPGRPDPERLKAAYASPA